jgi:hypothetical protein
VPHRETGGLDRRDGIDAVGKSPSLDRQGEDDASHYLRPDGYHGNNQASVCTGFHRSAVSCRRQAAQPQRSAGTICKSYFGTRSTFSSPSALYSRFFTITSPQGGLQRHSGGGACQESKPRVQACSHVIEYFGLLVVFSSHVALQAGTHSGQPPALVQDT